MSTTFPSLSISLSDERYSLLDLTCNPCLLTRHPLHARAFRPPERQHILWLELVFGHDDDVDRPLPDVVLDFSMPRRQGASSRKHAVCRDGVAYGRALTSYQVYHHYWAHKDAVHPQHSDPLGAAFGPSSDRVVGSNDITPVSAAKRTERCLGALAFQRRSIFAPYAYDRLFYPSTFSRRQEHTNMKGLRYRLSNVRPFAPDTHEPLPHAVTISRAEAVGFWLRLDVPTVDSDLHDGRHATIVFLQGICVDPSNLPVKDPLRINYFPRLPLRYSIESSTPELRATPQLISVPPAWGLEAFETTIQYSAISDDEASVRRVAKDRETAQLEAKEASPERPQLYLLLQAHDRQLESTRSTLIFFYSLAFGFGINILAATLLHSYAQDSNARTAALLVTCSLLSLILLLLVSALGLVGVRRRTPVPRSVSGRDLMRAFIEGDSL